MSLCQQGILQRKANMMVHMYVVLTSRSQTACTDQRRGRDSLQRLICERKV